MPIRNFIHSIIFFTLLLTCGCKTQKSVPPYGASTSYNTSDTTSNTIKQNEQHITSAELNREEATQQNLNKSNTSKIPKNKKTKIIPKLNLCDLCQGYVMAKKAKKILQPPRVKGCFAGFAILAWVVILPVLVIIAGMLYFIALLTIIVSTLILAAIIAGLALLILLAFGLITWLSVFLTIIFAVVAAAFLLYWLCKKCN